MNRLVDHLEILGFRVKDKITGWRGVATSVSFDLYGCIQVVVSPPLKTDGTKLDGRWFDKHRLDIISTKRVMALPDFARAMALSGPKGPAEKPIP